MVQDWVAARSFIELAAAMFKQKRMPMECISPDAFLTVLNIICT
jgi:hypothetical protein